MRRSGKTAGQMDRRTDIQSRYYGEPAVRGGSKNGDVNVKTYKCVMYLKQPPMLPDIAFIYLKPSNFNPVPTLVFKQILIGRV